MTPQGAAPEEAGPATQGQARLWLADRMAPGGYVIQRAFRLRGSVDGAALGRSLDLLVRRHQALRTVYRVARSGLEQVVLGEQAAAFEVVELDESRVDGWISARLAEPFDLARGPLIRADLLRLADGDAVLLVTVHHIAVDGWSLSIVFHELGLAYEAFAAGREPELPPAPAYLAYARADAAKDRQALYEHWRGVLDGVPACTLAVDREPRGRRSIRAHAAPVTLPAAAAAAFAEVSWRNRCTPYMLATALYAAVLTEHSGADEIVVGMPAAGRASPEVYELLGYLVNLVPLRIGCPADVTLVDLLSAVRETCLTALRHDDVPIEQLISASGLGRTGHRAPLAQALLDMPPPLPPPLLADLEVEPRPIQHTTTRLELELHLFREPEGYSGVLLGSADIFEADTVRGLAERFVDLAARWPATPERALKGLS